MADPSALFACTKCNSRHPFEELSQSEQLCKECRNNYPVVKCTYCRSEFQQGKGSTNTICKKCAQNVKSYGKPTACEYCNVIAAFIGNRCQRCTNSEKKYGPPTTCEQCKQKCAFDRTEESQKKVDGKILCWLCTLAYRRVLAKTRNRQEEALKNYYSNQQRSNSNDAGGSSSRPIVLDSEKSSVSNRENTDKNRNTEKPSSKNVENKSSGNEVKKDSSVESNSGEKNNDKTSGKDKQTSGEKHRHHHHHHKHHHHHHRHGSGDKHRDHSSKDKSKDHKTSSHKSKTHHSNNNSHHDHNSSSSKKPKLDSTPTSTSNKTTTNGVTPTKSSGMSTSMTSLSEKSIPDLNSTDHMIAITQLREELEVLKKQVQGKDQQIKERDMKITELKAFQYESEKEVRTKITTLQKRHSEAIETLQIKNRDLMKQVASLSKGNKGNKSIAAGSPAL